MVRKRSPTMQSLSACICSGWFSIGGMAGVFGVQVSEGRVVRNEAEGAGKSQGWRGSCRSWRWGVAFISSTMLSYNTSLTSPRPHPMEHEEVIRNLQNRGMSFLTTVISLRAYNVFQVSLQRWYFSRCLGETECMVIVRP